MGLGHQSVKREGAYTLMTSLLCYGVSLMHEKLALKGLVAPTSHTTGKESVLASSGAESHLSKPIETLLQPLPTKGQAGHSTSMGMGAGRG